MEALTLSFSFHPSYETFKEKFIKNSEMSPCTLGPQLALLTSVLLVHIWVAMALLQALMLSQTHHRASNR
jgi:hypothetical protein